ncbi:hypothetical protein LSUE1_G007104 [Lachnellula suecica]|uniref:ABM domain-containing protein n=1 Tax=Lachnellula suecica TaxID=602035 RepID=A0A8T9CBM4_9HELO|nr:hypothetical protein LSUE1_G007104 [Lachnellula suecica]
MSEQLHAVAIIHPTPGKETRDQTGTNVFLYQEIYDNKEAVDIHMKSSHFISAVGTLTAEGLVTKPIEIIAINPVGGFASR